MWSKAHVHANTRGAVTFHHRLVGRLNFNWETLTLNGTPDYELKLYVAVDRQTSDAVALLGSLAAGQETSTAPRDEPRIRHEVEQHRADI
jgi:hypothetical protein